MITRRHLAAAAAALAGTPLLARPADAAEISVTQYGTSLYGLPYTVAEQLGSFKQQGVDITGFIGSGGGGTTVRNLFASDTPYGEVAVGAALAAAAGGLPLKIVDVGTRSVAEASIVTMPGSAIRSLQDLVGKKIALTSPKGVSEMLFLLAMKKAGLDAGKVERVYSGGYGPGLTLLEQGAVAAAALIEPLSIERGEKYRTVLAYKDVLPPMTTSVGITSTAFAAAHGDTLRGIIAGRRAGVRAIYADPAAAAAICASAYRIPPPIANIAVDNMIGPRMWSEGNFDQAELDRMIEALGLIGQVPPPGWAGLIDKSFLPPDLRG